LKNLVGSGPLEVFDQQAALTNEVKTMIRQTGLLFKHEKRNDLITAHTGPALSGEFARIVNSQPPKDEGYSPIRGMGE